MCRALATCPGGDPALNLGVRPPPWVPESLEGTRRASGNEGRKPRSLRDRASEFSLDGICRGVDPWKLTAWTGSGRARRSHHGVGLFLVEGRLPGSWKTGVGGGPHLTLREIPDWRRGWGPCLEAQSPVRSFLLFSWWILLKTFQSCASFQRTSPWIHWSFISIFSRLYLVYFCSHLIISFLLFTLDFICCSFSSSFKCEVRLFLWAFSCSFEVGLSCYESSS